MQASITQSSKRPAEDAAYASAARDGYDTVITASFLESFVVGAFSAAIGENISGTNAMKSIASAISRKPIMTFRSALQSIVMDAIGSPQSVSPPSDMRLADQMKRVFEVAELWGEQAGGEFDIVFSNKTLGTHDAEKAGAMSVRLSTSRFCAYLNKEPTITTLEPIRMMRRILSHVIPNEEDALAILSRVFPNVHSALPLAARAGAPIEIAKTQLRLCALSTKQMVHMHCLAKLLLEQWRSASASAASAAAAAAAAAADCDDEGSARPCDEDVDMCRRLLACSSVVKDGLRLCVRRSRSSDDIVLRRVLSAIGDLSKKHATIMFSENGKTIAACGIAERADQGICIKRPSLTAVARGQDDMTTLRPVGRDQQSAVVFIKSHIFAEGFAPTKGASNEDLVVTFENAN